MYQTTNLFAVSCAARFSSLDFHGSPLRGERPFNLSTSSPAMTTLASGSGLRLLQASTTCKQSGSTSNSSLKQFWAKTKPSLTSYASAPIPILNETRVNAPLDCTSDRSERIQFPHRCNFESHRWNTVQCRVMTPNAPAPSTTLMKEPHKYFDHVAITIRAGDGGHGAILNAPNTQRATKQDQKEKEKKPKKRSSFKRDFDGSLILPMGGHGGDVVIYVDEGKDTLLEFHNKGRFNAKRGGNVDAMGGFSSQLHDGIAAPTLRIPVPVGTVVKSKRGKMLADLAQPGDEVLVARGGQGGISLLEVPQQKKKKMMALTTNVMRDDSDKVLVHGQPGEEVKLELILRVVADVGLVGLPNAGKSTLLAAITLAKPDIADYPFTTLMPNLGRLGGDPSLGAGVYSSEATLADLPGLIEGAHLGKGLGRNFLRHLRRTRLLVHVVDAATENPLNDYITVKEELRMYNPEYLERPYIVVLNKIDLLEAKDRLSSLTEEILRIGNNGAASKPKPSFEVSAQSLSEEGDQQERKLEDYPPPLSVVGVSVLKGMRINEMLKEIRAALRKCTDSSGPSGLPP